MKGQAGPIASVASVVLVAVFVLVGAIVYGYASNATPHDITYSNETICTATCSPHTIYEMDHWPILNNSALICYNTSSDILVRGGEYNVFNGRYINLTNTSDVTYQPQINCTYTYDWASAGQQGFYDNTTENAFSAFILTSVIVIVLAAVGILGIVLLIRG